MKRASLLTLAILAGWTPARAQAPLTLAEAVRGALARNERAQIAARDLEAAEARLSKARSLFFPDLTFTGKWRHAPEITRSVGIVREPDVLSGALEAKLTVFDARSFPLYGAAGLERDAQRLDTAEARRKLAFQAADAFLVTLSAEQALAVSERRTELARRTLEDATRRREAALVGSNDVTKAELELATAERGAARARAEATSARLVLSNLVGAPVDGALVPPADLTDARTAESPQDLVDRALRARSDAAALRLRARAADRKAGEPLWRAIPTLALLGQYSISSSGGFAGRDRDWFIGADLVWALYDGGERYADRDERLALAAAEALRARALERDVELEVRQAMVDVEAGRLAGAKAEVAAGAARKNAEEVAALYREGLATALDVADASARAYEAELAAVGERYGWARSVLGLRSALGMDPTGREAP